MRGSTTRTWNAWTNTVSYDILANMPDASLIAKIQAGDVVAFEALFREYHPALVSFAAALLGTPDAADDVVSDVFATLWEQRTTWHPRSVKAYLFGAVRHRALNRIRDGKRTVAWDMTLDESDIQAGTLAAPRPDQILEHGERMAALQAAIEQLPHVRRMVMSLRWQQEMDIDEIAEALGISENSVRLHVSRAVRWLREVLSVA